MEKSTNGRKINAGQEAADDADEEAAKEEAKQCSLLVGVGGSG